MSEYNITTFVDHQTGEKVGSMDFAMPSLKVGMPIKMLGGSRDYHFIVKSWEYIFSASGPKGLVVSVEVV